MSARFSRRKFAMGAIASHALVQTISAQQYRYSPEHRRPVEQTIHDVQEIAARHRYREEQRERVEHAIRNLREFGARLHQGGRFDRPRLDAAILDVQRVADRNPMGTEARERLRHDVAELRRLREHWEEYHWR